MKRNLIQSYLKNLEGEVRPGGCLDVDALAEIESHPLESVEGGIRRGLNPAEAEAETLRRFGSVEVVSSIFEQERISPTQKLILMVGLSAGLFVAYVDTRPAWDDTGLTAGVIVLLCGLLALIGYKRPWLLALVIGSWIPLYGLLVSHSPASILALIIAFAGAYAGWALRAGWTKISHLRKGAGHA